MMLLVWNHKRTLRIRKWSTILLFSRLRSLHYVLRSMCIDVEISLRLEELLEFYRLNMRWWLVVWGRRRSCLIKSGATFYLNWTLVCLHYLMLSLCFILRNSFSSFHVCTFQRPTVFIAKLSIGHLQLLSPIYSWNLCDCRPSLSWTRMIVGSLPRTLILSQLSRAISRASCVIREWDSAIYKHLLMNLRINSWCRVPFFRWWIQNFQDHVSQGCWRLRLLHRLYLVVFPKGSWLFSF